MILYHQSLYVPPALLQELQGRYLRVSIPAAVVPGVRQLGLPLPKYVTLTPERIVEVGENASRRHVVYREPFRYDADAVYALALNLNNAAAALLRAWAVPPSRRATWSTHPLWKYEAPPFNPVLAPNE